jgi:hypothetical protein
MHKGTYIVGILAALLIIILTVALAGTTTPTPTASAGPLGAITGKVLECGPGPVVVNPGSPPPTAIPEKVVLVHRGHTYESQSITFPKKTPWTGAFSFTVPPGKYEVISTYTGPVRWVNVKSGGHYVVKFGLVACAD